MWYEHQCSRIPECGIANNVSSGNNVPDVKKETKLIYDESIQTAMDNLLLDIQRELQIEKYFMPPKKDLSRAVTEM